MRQNDKDTRTQRLRTAAVVAEAAVSFFGNDPGSKEMCVGDQVSKIKNKRYALYNNLTNYIFSYIIYM